MEINIVPISSPVCHFAVNISHWKMVCNKILTPTDWCLGEDHWASNSQDWQVFNPKLTFLPPLKRRRLSDSARLFFEAAWELTQSDSNLPVVYASLNSEINRSFTLWYQLLKDNEISPTSFSLSVHNALVGQWSELCQITSETTAIAAKRDNLETALMEAYLLLNDGYDKVLVVVAESPLYQEYDVKPINRLPFAYALAMLVERGKTYQLSLLPSHHSSDKEQSDHSLIWVKNHYRNQTIWQTSSSTGGIWQWQKN